MRHTRLEDSEVFNAFAEIAAKEGLLEKKAEMLYPDFDISVSSPELDIKIAGDKRTELYDVTGESGESLIQAAHPGGGTVADDSGSQDYGKVETIVEQHNRNTEIARSMPTGKLASLMAKLVALADELDEDGFTALAKNLDTEIEKLAQGAGYAQIPLQMPAMQGPTAEEQKRLQVQDPRLQQMHQQQGQQQLGQEESWDMTEEAQQMYDQLAREEARKRMQQTMGPALQQVRELAQRPL